MNNHKIYLFTCLRTDPKIGFQSTIGMITTEKEVADKWLKDFSDQDPSKALDIIELDNLTFEQFWIESVQGR